MKGVFSMQINTKKSFALCFVLATTVSSTHVSHGDPAVGTQPLAGFSAGGEAPTQLQSQAGRVFCRPTSLGAGIPAEPPTASSVLGGPLFRVASNDYTLSYERSRRLEWRSPLP